MNGDADLLRRYVEERSEAAFTELVRRHLNLVYFAALRKVGGDVHTAEEVTQTVFTALARQARSLGRRPVIASWLHTTTRFTAVKAQRANWRRNKYEQEIKTMPDFLHDAASSAEWVRLRPMIDEVVGELNDADREAVLLRFFEGHSLAAVGAALQVSEDAARMRVDRALDKLHLLLSRRGITSTATALTAALASPAVAAAPAGLAANVAGTALASVDLTVTSEVGLLQFMSTTKFAIGAGVLLGLLAIGTAVYEIRARHTAEDTLASARQSLGLRVAALRDLERQVGAAEKVDSQLSAGAKIPGARDAGAGVQQAAGTQATVAPATWDPVKEGEAFLRHHPEFRQAIVVQLRAYTRFQNDPVYKALHLTPAQIEKVQKLMTANWNRGDTVTADGKMGAFYSDTAMPPDEAVNQLRSVLGEEGFMEFIKSREMVTPRDLAVQAASTLAVNQTPLTPEQSDQLTQIIAANRFDQSAGQTRSAFDWETVIANARGFLSASQLPALESLRATATSARTAWEDRQNLNLIAPYGSVRGLAK